MVLGREGKQTEAVVAINDAIKLNPKQPSATLFLGIFLYQMGHFSEAIDALHRELDIDSNSVDALSWLGIVELAAGHRRQTQAGRLKPAGVPGPRAQSRRPEQLRQNGSHRA